MSTTSNMGYTGLPEEVARPPKEYINPPERVDLPTNEYYGQKELKKTEGGRKKRGSLLKSIAALLSMVTVVSASLGIDFFKGTSIPSGLSPSEGDMAFPVLENLYPDFDGNYAWSDMGSEEYLRIVPGGGSDYTYLVLGKAWETMGYSLGTVDGASYNRNTNTLTMENCSAQFIDANLMGNSFTIELIGENHIGSIEVWGAYYGGSLTITGPGSLIVDEEIVLEAEFSQSCLMVDASVEVMGSITISATSMEKAIYYKAPLKLTGGKRASGDFFKYTRGDYDENGNYVSVEAVISEIRGEKGERYYDYAVVDDDGNIATHVIFAK